MKEIIEDYWKCFQDMIEKKERNWNDIKACKKSYIIMVAKSDITG